ncbi:hypothetical protein J2S13_001967 [Oikeobacillus pervagus]|uniref:Uncharacterized protein n=1 Tax=Oikeobacillus pervagus TaxID=1325931 RepID=A0AAJ1SZJ2_9BACI|nr:MULTISPECIES: hypothetical protein [Bacillaceae]MDQ0215549.1 hypothetical protein [Oikeobacillus pervagus]
MDRMDELLNSWQLNRAYNKFWEDKGDSIQSIYETIENQFKDIFFTGYETGHEDGYFSGKTDAKVKLMVKLAVHTNLDDNTILKVLEKENEAHFINGLKEIREKQKNEG